jgi:hypothetical protein
MQYAPPQLVVLHLIRECNKGESKFYDQGLIIYLIFNEQEIDERARALKARMRSSLSASSSYSSRGPSIENEGSVRSNRGLSPDREWADSDLESVTSAFSTQSENPNRLR